MLLDLASVHAKDRETRHIHSTHSINTGQHPTPTALGKVYKRAVVVPPSSPHQRAFVCGACTRVKFGCMQGCCVGARPVVRSWWTMVQVTVSTGKKNGRCRVPIVSFAATRPQFRWEVFVAWEKGHGGCGSEGSMGMYGQGGW